MHDACYDAALLLAPQVTAPFCTHAPLIAAPAASYLRVCGAAFPFMAAEMAYEGALAGGRCSTRVLTRARPPTFVAVVTRRGQTRTPAPLS